MPASNSGADRTLLKPREMILSGVDFGLFMPRLMKTIVPRFRRSLKERGVASTLLRSPLIPFSLLREYLMAKRLGRAPEHSDFDRKYGVNTDGELGGWTYLSDLDIPSPNWIYGRNYAGIEPERFFAIFESLPIQFEEFVFIDFGSGKGRALLMASEFPFKRIIGIEFSPQLNAIAVQNIARYASPTQKCRRIEAVRMDFSQYFLPSEPLVLFFFDPCEARVLEQVFSNLRLSYEYNPRPIYVVYVAPAEEWILRSSDFLAKSRQDARLNFCVYSSLQKVS
jgi:Putative methyltransferase